MNVSLLLSLGNGGKIFLRIRLWSTFLDMQLEMMFRIGDGSCKGVEDNGVLVRCLMDGLLLVVLLFLPRSSPLKMEGLIVAYQRSQQFED